MDALTRRKWDRAAGAFDFINGLGAERRWEPVKREFFSTMHGRVLFVAVGTGLDIRYFPPAVQIDGIDISDKMLERARPRAEAYAGPMTLRHLDVHDLDYPAGTFDQVFTSCTFCSVPDPVRALEAVRRVLKPAGELRMFEHTGSRYFPFNALLNLMNPIARLTGPEINRDTVGNVRRAGFRLVEVRHAYLDVVKTIHAVAPA
ncbi:MAG: class I SAM-dependent methyltransferase [Vicinamibacterales bacterium]|jgi:ubiquinone/menaquinone biosynthesis C-methylase UbiE|nr:SAM-dependent methyltransferase [Acidobacteriota bacterium]MDP6372088.1 class I SAM-dependent methyltransferase [Vicinamibacterales bacterium]MDP6609285.1 class I SAM-dependent methyltransferase [Vicinamibacterales bacterium]HAK55111.1 class I SAM-dependent methyltransferase [Acidobacteriota bacterium]|tara:strand:+ start:4899 stop:5507 length:609 start_codon:yes stop_codon:yes gene_type:complete